MSRHGTAQPLTARISLRVTSRKKAEVGRAASQLGLTESGLLEMLIHTPFTLNTPLDELRPGVQRWREGKEN